MSLSMVVQTPLYAYDLQFYQANDVLDFNPEDGEICVGSDPLSTIRTTEGTEQERAWDLFTGHGLSDEQAAGIMGNIQAESGFDPNARNGSSYYGIAQWSTSDRWRRLVSWAESKGLDEWAFDTQLEYLWKEATDRGNIEGLGDQADVPHAAWYWGRYFEVAIINGSTSDVPLTNVQDLGKRTTEAERFYNTYRGSGGTGSGATPTVALDPGHGGAIAEYTDRVTGLKDRETPNSPEREDVLEVARRVKSTLESDGYNVVLLRTSANQTVNKRQRVDKAKRADADIAVSIHTAPGEINQVWPQRVGMYRELRGDRESRVTFQNEQTARKSEQYARIMAEARSEAEGHQVTTDPDQATQSGAFSESRDIPSVGNISLLQLWSSDIPWVYNEIEQNTPSNGINDQRKQAYADGISDGIKEALPVTGSGTSGGDEECTPSGSTRGNGDAINTALEYAWHDYRGDDVTMKPEYRQATSTATSEGRYIGGIAYPGVDCGGFVTTVMVDSGFESNYNHGGKTSSGAGNTVAQLAWVRENWTKIGRATSTSELQPGDVAFRVTSSGDNDGHTFMYVGNQPGFDDDIASASLDGRAPMAGPEDPLASNIEWYRKG